MKLRTGRLITVLLLLTVFLASTLAAASAQGDPAAYRVTSAKISRTTDALVLRMELLNSGDTGIGEFGLALAFYDKNGERFYALGNTQEGYLEEVSYWYYAPSETIQAGATYKTEDSFAAYLDASRVDIAIRYYQRQSGEYVNIPESQWIWYSTEGGVVVDYPSQSYYLDPSSDLYSVIADVNIGYEYYLLDDYNAAFYGYKQGGEWITEVEVGSIADTVGLKAGDLVLSVDGVKPTEDYYAVEYAMAKIAKGKSIDWVYERDGSESTVSLSLPK
jgi:hypothetical protein